MSLMAQPALVRALERGRVGIGHAMAVLVEISHLELATAAQVLAAVLGEDEAEIDATAGELKPKRTPPPPIPPGTTQPPLSDDDHGRG